MKELKQRPGVVLYFDTLVPVLNRVSGDQCLNLMRGIVNYVQTGEIPELDDIASFAFDMLRPGIDNDGERYEKKKEEQRIHGQYMAYCRELKRQGVSKNEWPSEADYKDMLADANSNYQLQTETDGCINTKPTTTPYPATESTIESEQVGKGKVGGCKGDERKNPDELYSMWLDALDNGCALDNGANDKAYRIQNELFKMGYDVDKNTRQMTRRQTS